MPPSVQWFPCVISILRLNYIFLMCFWVFYNIKILVESFTVMEMYPLKMCSMSKDIKFSFILCKSFFYAITNDNQIQVCNFRVGVFNNDWIIPLENVKNDDELYCYRARKSIKKTTIILSSFLYQSLCITYD